MALNAELIKRISKRVGLTPREITGSSPNEIREHLTKRTGKAFKVVSHFPTIGRGNVLRDGAVTSEQINREIDKILGL